MAVVDGIFVDFQVQVEGVALSTDVLKIPRLHLQLHSFFCLVATKLLQVHWMVLPVPGRVGTDEVHKLVPLQLQDSFAGAMKCSYQNSNHIFVVVVVVGRLAKQCNVVGVPDRGRSIKLQLSGTSHNCYDGFRNPS